MKYLLRAVATALAAWTCLFCWQFYSMTKAFDDARQAAAQEWANTSSRVGFLNAYENVCEHGNVVFFMGVGTETVKKVPLLTWKKCAAQLAQEKAGYYDLPVAEAEGLGQAIEAALDRIEIPAPIRWF